MFIFRPLFFVKHESIFRFDSCHFIIESHEVMLEIFELKQLSLEGGDNVIFVMGLGFFVPELTFVVAGHFLIEISLNVYRKIKPFANP